MLNSQTKKLYIDQGVRAYLWSNILTIFDIFFIAALIIISFLREKFKRLIYRMTTFYVHIY